MPYASENTVSKGPIENGIEQATMEVSWAMKDGTGDFTGGIPADFNDDAYWP